MRLSQIRALQKVASQRSITAACTVGQNWTSRSFWSPAGSFSRNAFHCFRDKAWNQSIVNLKRSGDPATLLVHGHTHPHRSHGSADLLPKFLGTWSAQTQHLPPAGKAVEYLDSSQAVSGQWAVPVPFEQKAPFLRLVCRQLLPWTSQWATRFFLWKLNRFGAGNGTMNLSSVIAWSPLGTKSTSEVLFRVTSSAGKNFYRAIVFGISQKEVKHEEQVITWPLWHSIEILVGYLKGSL